MSRLFTEFEDGQLEAVAGAIYCAAKEGAWDEGAPLNVGIVRNLADEGIGRDATWAMPWGHGAVSAADFPRAVSAF